MADCMKCFNCVARIPLIYPKNGNILGAKIDYRNAKIRCKKGHWRKEDGTERIYKRFDNFHGKQVTKENINCEDYDA